MNAKRSAAPSMNCHLAAWAVVLLAPAAVTAQRGPLVTVETLQEELVGELLELTETSMNLAGDTFVSLPVEEVLAIHFEKSGRSRFSERSGGEVFTTRGSRLTYNGFEIGAESVTFRRDARSTLEIPLAAIDRWVLDRAAAIDASERESGGLADRLWVKSRSGEGLTPVEGVILDVTEAGVRFAFDPADPSDAVTAPWRRLAAIDFFREDSDRQATARTIRLRDGGRLSAAMVSLRDGVIHWESPDGARGFVRPEEIETIHLATDRLHAVGGLRLVGSAWRPYFVGAARGTGYALNTSLADRPLSLRFPDVRLPSGWPEVYETRSFDTGIALRSRGELRFELPPKSKRLKGWIGLDPAAVLAGAAEVSVLADERLVWSGTIDGSIRPVALNEPLRAEATLTLRVDYGDNLDAGDRIHFVDLRVIQ